MLGITKNDSISKLLGNYLLSQIGHHNPIIADIIDQQRAFLPGEAGRPDVANIEANLSGNVLFDGLTKTEANLVLSTLPRGINRILLRPLDKGLSGSKVLAGRYETAKGSLSKPFVFKIGPVTKIQIEYDALEKYVRPFISGIGQPIIRKSHDVGLLVQDIAGLTPSSELTSLKDYIRTNSSDCINRLLRQRLEPWYANTGRPLEFETHLLDDLFKWYLDKLGTDPEYPPSWTELQKWVFTSTGYGWSDVSGLIEKLKNTQIRSPSGIIHGDLHTQNILIDERGECWPIDFYWCHDSASPLVDMAMLECSLKFLAIHQRSDLRCLIDAEKELLASPSPTISVGLVPYSVEIGNVLKAVGDIRKFVIEVLKTSFEDYRKVLCLMTYVHSTHSKLNRPYVLSSLQILAGIERSMI